ncbi:MAG: hypothetical protein ACI4F4_07495, partial [Lachnospiraceae bacterium]
MKMLVLSDNSTNEYGFEIAVDLETGVNYFRCNGILTPRYKRDGLLYVSSKEEIEQKIKEIEI